MRGFIKVQVNHSDQYVAVDQIRDFRVADRYHPNENAVITLKDQTKITTDWTNSVKSIADDIAQASQ